MSMKNKDGIAPIIAPEVLARIVESLKPVRKDQVDVYKRNERPPIMSFISPARGRITKRGIRQVGDLAVDWGLDSRYPQALRALESAVRGFVMFEPVAIWDPAASDQFQIVWYEGFRKAHVDLRPILQPRNLEVPPGYISEMPLSLQQLPNINKTFLFLHTGEAKVRPMAEIPPDEEEDDFIDDGPPGQAPADQAAPSKEK